MKKIAFALTFLLLLASRGDAKPFLTCESSYLTNGWFQYNLTLHNEPLFDRITELGIHVMGITNPVEIESESAPWITESAAGFVSLECQVDYALEPQTVTLRFQSEYTSFKKGTAYLTFGGSLSGQYYGEAATEGIVGYYQAECLIPCPASEADGSPSTLVDWWENNPDIKIDGIFMLNNEPRGLKISWHRESTMVLQTCDDLLSWRNYCWIHVTPPTTTWTSTVPLEAIGKYYRLQLFSIP